MDTSTEFMYILLCLVGLGVVVSCTFILCSCDWSRCKIPRQNIPVNETDLLITNRV